MPQSKTPSKTPEPISAVSTPPSVAKLAKDAVSLNREAWLCELARKCESLFTGYKLGPYRLTCGWPSRYALGKRRRVLGECHHHKSSKSGTHEIFITPLLDETPAVAGVLMHELGHVAAGVDAGHGPKFAAVCKHVGLTKGRPTVAVPGPELEVKLLKLAEPLGAYPHAAIVPTLKDCKPPSAVRLQCESCGCKIGISIKWLEEAGAPTCGCGGEMNVVIPKIGEGEKGG